MHLHEIVKIDAGAFSAVHSRLTAMDVTHETQTIDRGDRRLDPPDAGAEPGARCRRAGPEESRLSAAGLVRRAARIVARAVRRDAPGGAGKADADPAILHLAADRPPGRRGAGGAPRMQDRQARPVRRDHRGRARTAEEDVERLFGGDRKTRRLKTVRCRRHEALRSARPAGLLLRGYQDGRRPGRRARAMMFPIPFVLADSVVRSISCPMACSVESPHIRIIYGA